MRSTLPTVATALAAVLASDAFAPNPFVPQAEYTNAQYVWHLSNVASPTGNAATDSCPIVRFIVP